MQMFRDWSRWMPLQFWSPVTRQSTRPSLQRLVDFECSSQLESLWRCVMNCETESFFTSNIGLKLSQFQVSVNSDCSLSLDKIKFFQKSHFLRCFVAQLDDFEKIQWANIAAKVWAVKFLNVTQNKKWNHQFLVKMDDIIDTMTRDLHHRG